MCEIHAYVILYICSFKICLCTHIRTDWKYLRTDTESRQIGKSNATFKDSWGYDMVGAVKKYFGEKVRLN